MKAKKSNSSYGNWVVYVSNLEMFFFMRKKDADNFVKTFVGPVQ